MLKQERFQTETPNVIDPGESPPSRPSRPLQGIEAETILPRQRARHNGLYTRTGNKGELARGIPLRLDDDLDDDDDDRSFYDDDDDEDYSEQQGLFRDEEDDEEDESGIAQARLFANAMLYESTKRQNSQRNLFGSSLVKRASSFRNSNHSRHSVHRASSMTRASSLRTIGRSSSHRSIPVGSNSSDKNIWLVDDQDEPEGRFRSKQSIYIMVAVVVTLLVGMLSALTISQWQAAKRFSNTNIAVNHNRFEEIIDFLGEDQTGVSSRQDLSDMNSPQYKAAEWLSRDDSEMPFTFQSEFVQRYVLLVLYFSLGGDGWTNDYHFASHEHHECSWFERVVASTDEMTLEGDDGLYSIEETPRYLAMGVSCDNQLRVTSIFLPSNNLEGSIPSELQYLRMLESLDLRNNSIVGTIPNELANIVHLAHLDLSDNHLTGQATPLHWIPKLAHLEFLDLSKNQLDLDVPKRNDSQVVRRESRLTTLLLSGNNPNPDISGSIPEEIRYLTNLQVLSLDNTNIGGTIPPWIFRELPKLEFLDLSHNELTGTMNQVSVGSLQHLQTLLLHDNPLTGTLPESIGSLPNIATVTIHHTNMQVGVDAANLICWEREETTVFETLTTDCGDESCLCCMENCCDGDECYHDVDWHSMVFHSSENNY